LKTAHGFDAQNVSHAGAEPVRWQTAISKNWMRVAKYLNILVKLEYLLRWFAISGPQYHQPVDSSATNLIAAIAHS
jgi:hypothetical protein